MPMRMGGHLAIVLLLAAGCSDQTKTVASKAQASSAPVGPSTEQVFVAQFQAALETKDIEKVLVFWHWDAQTSAARETVKKYAMRLFEGRLKEVRIVPLRDGQQETYEAHGLKLRHTLAPVCNAVVAFEEEGGGQATIELPLGKTDGIYRVLEVFPAMD